MAAAFPAIQALLWEEEWVTGKEGEEEKEKGDGKRNGNQRATEGTETNDCSKKKEEISKKVGKKSVRVCLI